MKSEAPPSTTLPGRNLKPETIWDSYPGVYTCKSARPPHDLPKRNHGHLIDATRRCPIQGWNAAVSCLFFMAARHALADLGQWRRQVVELARPFAGQQGLSSLSADAAAKG